jgi:CHAD domain-containing protein
MELFLSCFNRKKYLNFYKTISKLQDLSGEVRDLDIFRNNISVYLANDPPIRQKIITDKFEEKKDRLQSRLKLEIMKFVHGKNLKEINRMIKNHV